MIAVNPISIVISGVFGGVCAATISDASHDIETGREFNSKERVLQFLSRTLLATISAVAAHALAHYAGADLVIGTAFLGCVLYGFYNSNGPEDKLSHGTTAKILAIVSGIFFSFFPWARLASP